MTLGRLLVVEDDQGVQASLARSLEIEGYEVQTAADGIAALIAIDTHRPDAIVLDIRLPQLDGLGVARRLRARGDPTPILMLTARDQVTDRVAGLDAGADDYLAKPFSLAELLARLRALLRRTTVSGQTQTLRVSDLELDPAARDVRRAQRPLHLTKTEFDLLELLVSNPGMVMSREVILDRIWGYDFEPTSNSLEVYVGYLRRKIEAEGGSRLIHTVRGVGYMVKEP